MDLDPDFPDRIHILPIRTQEKKSDPDPKLCVLDLKTENREKRLRIQKVKKQP